MDKSPGVHCDWLLASAFAFSFLFFFLLFSVLKTRLRALAHLDDCTLAVLYFVGIDLQGGALKPIDNPSQSYQSFQSTSGPHEMKLAFPKWKGFSNVYRHREYEHQNRPQAHYMDP